MTLRLALVALFALTACGGDPDPSSGLTLTDTTHVLVPVWNVPCSDVWTCRAQRELDRWPLSAFDATEVACVQGRCVLVCLSGISLNCDGNINNGCEARTPTCP